MQKSSLEIIFDDATEVLKRVDFSFLEGKTILVTGATGLLGTHFLATLALLNEHGANIKVFGVCHSDPADYTKEVAKRGNLHLIGDPLFFDADVIIHANGYAQPSVFTKHPAETIRINTTLTQQLLDNLRPGGKFLFVSSSEIYSGLEYSVASESKVGTVPLNHPRIGYIEGKRCGEVIINANRQLGLDAKSARLGLTYGPGTRENDKRAMCQFIRQALIEDKVELKYAGREPRVFCYISDAVEMLWNICLHGTQPVYNVGGESEADAAGIAFRISQITGAKFIVPVNDKEMPGAPEIIKMDLTLVKNEFKKFDFVSLEEGLKRTISWGKNLYAMW